MNQLSDFLESKNRTSKFKTTLGVQGGFITFSNTNGNTFTIGLNAVLTCVKDFINNPVVFTGDQVYDEKPWRDLGSQYYTDPVPRSLATVQTKPLFTTLSKTIVWANQPILNAINTDNIMPLRLGALNKTVLELEKLIKYYTPKPNKRTNSIKIKELEKSYISYFTAIRTKPFILLAGISGIGKSRIIRELAFMSCPALGKLQADDTTPGNYCMIEVKPNWHDSTELLGYASGIKEKYVVTPFVKYLVKAMRYPEVPFFVCLDEMNLAPVEQYFAEYLSVLETRKLNGETIVSGSLINKDIFNKYEANIFIDIGLKTEERTDLENEWENNIAIESELKEFGLRLPQNVIVVGTVNMDDTTHQFSRKVIDRAMTIEMNNVNFAEMFSNEDKLQYAEEPFPYELFIADCASANHAFELIPEDSEELKEKTVEIMQIIDEKLKHTPFRVAYRVQNEMVIYFRNIRFVNPEKTFDELFVSTVDSILNMKVLPRIEGDEDLVEKPLKDLETWCTEKNYMSSLAKIKEMIERLKRTHYTSYWP